jgi:parallel beta-helix repeat protein
MGAGTGFQYGTKNVWFLFNHIYDNEIGIMVASANEAREEGNYFIGNLIHNIHTTSTYDVNDSYHEGQAFVMWGWGTKHIINNTIYDCDGGITFSNSPGCIIMNNIIGNIKPGTYGVFLENSATAAVAELQNNLFFGEFNVRWGSSRYTTLDGFKAATGKGQNCILADPLFVNSATGDFHLQTNSPAADAGIISDVYAKFQSLYGIDISKDMEGNSRPLGAGFDLGAYESR